MSQTTLMEPRGILLRVLMLLFGLVYIHVYTCQTDCLTSVLSDRTGLGENCSIPRDECLVIL